MKYVVLITTFSLIILPHFFCANSSESKEPPVDTITGDTSKPASLYQDTLIIEGKAAVFYSPDSVQLEQIRRRMKPGVFEATMHEYDNQLRISHLELAEHWRDIRIIEARLVRYLRFRKENGEQITIDLDHQGDPYGLYAFDASQSPQKIDMMNAGSQLYYYFKRN